MSPINNSSAAGQDESGIPSSVAHLSNLKISSGIQPSAPSPAMFANLVANIPPDVHARIEAYQHSRTSKPASSSSLTGSNSAVSNAPSNANIFGAVSGNQSKSGGSSQSGPSVPTFKAFSEGTANIQVDRRPLRIPQSGNYGATYKTTIPDYSQFYQKGPSQPSSEAKGPNQQTSRIPVVSQHEHSEQPSSSSSSSLSSSSSSTPLAFSGPLFAQMATSTPLNDNKLSLSARKGLKLNLTAQAGFNGPKSEETNELPLLNSNTVPQVVPRTLSVSGRKQNKAGLKLNLNEKTGSNNLFSNHAKYVDVKKGSLNFAEKASIHSKGIDFSSGSTFRISLDDLEPMGELGRGNYGTVTKVLHKPTKIVMAMKEIRLELEETKFSQIIMELEILHKCVSPYIVDFYGAFFVEGAVYVCMEYMDGGSLDKIYAGGVDEPYLAVITEAVVRGLKQLKEDHNIIHRDVKPTNILVSTNGSVKLCDFGVSGNLVASIARTNIGCQSYMAPERIKSVNPNDAITYTVQSDIWSLGLSILEVAKGSYPYPPETYSNIFSQLSAIVDGKPPSLPADKFLLSPDHLSMRV